MPVFRAVFVIVFVLFVFTSVPVFAEEVKKIQDNSFLIEEAYNQEDGVVQHIQTFQYMKGDSWAYTFTQEWPVPKQAHQLSYTIPVLKNPAPGRESGFGDVLLNYRYQAIMKEGIALSPRFSLILPTGDYKKGHGSGTVGYQINMPLSVELSDKVVTHWNMGLTFTPNAKAAGGGQGRHAGPELRGQRHISARGEF